MVCAGVAELFGPHALYLVCLADHDGLHHAGFVWPVVIKLCDPVESAGTQMHNGSLETRSARSWKYGDWGAHADGGGPVYRAPCQVALIIEGSGIAEVAGAPDARFHF